MSQRLFPQSVRMVNVGSVNVWGTTFLKLIYACCFSCVLYQTRANAAWILSAVSSLQFPLLYSQASTCLCVSVKKKKRKENDLTTVLRRLPNGSTISALPLLCPAVRTPPSPVGPVCWVHDLNDADLTKARVAPLPAKQTLAAASAAYYTARDYNSQQVAHWHA